MSSNLYQRHLPLWEQRHVLEGIETLTPGQDLAVSEGVLDGATVPVNYHGVLVGSERRFHEECNGALDYVADSFEIDRQAAWKIQRPFYTEVVRQFFSSTDTGPAWVAVLTYRSRTSGRYRPDSVSERVNPLAPVYRFHSAQDTVARQWAQHAVVPTASTSGVTASGTASNGSFTSIPERRTTSIMGSAKIRTGARRSRDFPHSLPFPLREAQ